MDKEDKDVKYSETKEYKRIQRSIETDGMEVKYGQTNLGK